MLDALPRQHLVNAHVQRIALQCTSRSIIIQITTGHGFLPYIYLPLVDLPQEVCEAPVLPRPILTRMPQVVHQRLAYMANVRGAIHRMSTSVCKAPVYLNRPRTASYLSQAIHELVNFAPHLRHHVGIRLQRCTRRLLNHLPPVHCLWRHRFHIPLHR